MGCGSGYVICSVAKMLSQHGLRAQVLASDISSAALQATQETLVAHGVSAHTSNMVTESCTEVPHRRLIATYDGHYREQGIILQCRWQTWSLSRETC